MRHILYIAMGLLQTQLSAYDNLSILGTTNWNNFQGNFSNVEVEITPANHYARIELTFQINVDSLNNNSYYSSKPTYLDQDLESFLSFEMPRNSYFYDSYLWLNANTIIRAKLMNMESASHIYDSIVNRKIDPSILRTYDNRNYTLNIFPISTTNSRKVKLCFAVPFKLYQSSKSKVELPTFIFNLIASNEKVAIKINSSTDLTFESFGSELNSSFVREDANCKEYTLSSQTLDSFPALYFQNVSQAKISFRYNIISEEEGFYEMRFNPDATSNFQTKETTNIYNFDIPFVNGFIYSKQNGNQNIISKGQYYIETGQFYGDIDFSNPIILNYRINGVNYSESLVVQALDSSQFTHQNFTSMYCQSNSTNTLAKEFSLRSRVLCNQTAFLALEDGDTVNSAKNNDYYYNYGSIDIGLGSIHQSNSQVECSVFPNPFLDKLTIKSEQPIVSVRIVNLLGQTIYSVQHHIPQKEITLDMNLLDIASGVYIISVETKRGVKTMRIVKE